MINLSVFHSSLYCFGFGHLTYSVGLMTFKVGKVIKDYIGHFMEANRIMSPIYSEITYGYISSIDVRNPLEKQDEDQGDYKSNIEEVNRNNNIGFNGINDKRDVLGVRLATTIPGSNGFNEGSNHTMVISIMSCMSNVIVINEGVKILDTRGKGMEVDRLLWHARAFVVMGVMGSALRLVQASPLPRCCIGDFNDILFASKNEVMFGSLCG
ncbi:unnamed protein product [Dovyalis caffra]|uniref:Uncharacterized protein n=1 Tax=Dovyalis caffra TaxID=77055 RepID=A0AAV1QNR9_9ROSI|nr:unnamed protein product [Dovyalis caffra]